MHQNVITVTCDMCDAERDFYDGKNGWRHKVLVETHTTESHRFGYETCELDLCPKCYGRCVAIKATVHENKYTEGYDEKPTYVETGRVEYAWKQDEQ